VDVDGLVAASVGQSPHVGQQLLLGHDLSRPAGEVGQQVELLGGELERPAVEDRRPRADVEHQAADHEVRGVLLPGDDPAQDGADPGVQLLRAERLHDVVVSTGVQQPHDGRVVVAGGGDDHGYVGDGPQHRQQGTAVEVGQAEVEHDDVRSLVDCRLQPGHRVRGGGDSVTSLAERAGQGCPDPRVVFDEQDLGHGGTVASAGRSATA
jgi:hypothetical protein